MRWNEIQEIETKWLQMRLDVQPDDGTPHTNTDRWSKTKIDFIYYNIDFR